jgi:carboxylesterase type B
MLAQFVSKIAPTYAYRFDIKPRTNSALEGVPEWMGVPNKFELIFVWGLPYWSQLPNNTQWDPADKRVSDIVMTLWANFIKFTNPTHYGVYIKWDPFVAETQGVLIIDKSFNMSSFNSFNYQSVKFWNSYFPRVLELASQCCNSSDIGGGHSMKLSFSASNVFLLVSLLIVTIFLNLTT